jgi:hypothetical protein
MPSLALGLKLATDMKRNYAISLLQSLREEVMADLLTQSLLNSEGRRSGSNSTAAETFLNLKRKLKQIDKPEAALLLQVAEFLEHKSCLDRRR